MLHRMLALMLVVVASGCGGSTDGGALKWKKEPRQAFELAHFTGKPMLLYFTSPG